MSKAHQVPEAVAAEVALPATSLSAGCRRLLLPHHTLNKSMRCFALAHTLNFTIPMQTFVMPHRSLQVVAVSCSHTTTHHQCYCVPFSLLTHRVSLESTVQSSHRLAVGCCRLLLLRLDHDDAQTFRVYLRINATRVTLNIQSRVGLTHTQYDPCDT